MADSDTLAIAVLGGVAVFGISWYLGNKLEDLGEFIGSGIKKGVINTVEAGGEFISGATGQERIEPRASRNLPITLWEPPDDVFLRMEGNKVLSATDNSVAGFPRAIAFPVEPPRETFITTPGADGVYRYPRVTPPRSGGIRLRSGLDFAWDALRYTPVSGLRQVPNVLDTIKGWWS